MKKILIGTLTIAALLATNAQNVQYLNNALNKYSDNINSGDARYIGMGGAMGALGGNVNSTNQNPAGIGVSISSDINFTLGVNSYENKSRFGSTRTTDDSQFQFQQVGANLVLPGANDNWKSFSLGFNYVSEELDNELLLGRNNNILFVDDSDPTNVQSYTFDGYGDFVNGYRQKLGFSFATNYQDKIYLGLSANFHSTDFTNSIAYAETNDTDGSSAIYEQVNTPYSEIADGFSFGLGVIAKVNQNLRLGAAYHSPVWYDFVEESFVGLDEGSDLTSDADNTFFNAISDYSLTTGGRFVGSAGLVLGKNLALNFDYTRHLNKGINLRPSDNFADISQFADDYLQNSSEFRVGGEYRYNKLRFRAGYNFVESPYEEIDGNFLNENNVAVNQVSDAFIGDINRFSAGLGYDFGNFYLDFAYQNQNQEFNYILGGTEFTTANAEVLNLDAYTTRVERNQNLFLLTAGWKF